MSYYTYVHSTPQGVPFYVGKGTGRRGYTHGDRSVQWQDKVRRCGGIQMAIACEWETEQEAFAHERFLVECFKGMGFVLVNKTSGGAGPREFKQSAETRALRAAKQTGKAQPVGKCPHCGTTGGLWALRHWHFDNCTGAKTYKARVTIDGKRVFLGNYGTKVTAFEVMVGAYEKAGKPVPKELTRAMRATWSIV